VVGVRRTGRGRGSAFAVLAGMLLLLGCLPVELAGSGASFGNDVPGDLDGDGVVDPGECIDPLSADPACSSGPRSYLWATISGPLESRVLGDPYAVRCVTGNVCGTPTNPDHRPDGHLVGIHVAEAGQVVTVQLYDAASYTFEHPNVVVDSASVPTQFELFEEDGNALTTRTTADLSMEGACSAGPGRRAFKAAQQPVGDYHNRWWTLCTFTAPTAGTYPVRVQTSDLRADPATGLEACSFCPWQGQNSFAVRASTVDGPQPVVRPLHHATVRIDAPGTTWSSPLVEVTPARAGTTMVVDLFNAHVGAQGTLALRRPDGTLPPCVQGWGPIGGAQGDTSAGTQAHGACSLATTWFTTDRYHGRWTRLTIDVPDGYTCAADCWWDLGLGVPSGRVAGRLTWAVTFEGG
jgi:hypothetical protein